MTATTTTTTTTTTAATRRRIPTGSIPTRTTRARRGKCASSESASA
jgi:hypothetical protein